MPVSQVLVPSRRAGATPGQPGWLALPALALLALLLPTYHDAAVQLWIGDEHAYAPLLTALSFCLVAYRLREIKLAPEAGVRAQELCLFAFGAALYVVGRSQRIELLELSALIPLVAAVLGLVCGRAAQRRARFGLLFLLFSLPYPGWLVDGLTGPLKVAISAGAESVLYAAGYPVARSGVVLALGQYRLLVADACSGLHSLIFLSALGLLYVHLTGYRPLWHRLALVAALVPIAVLANFLRVLVLLLLTYHFGDAVAQGYWHDLAGLILFVSAFAMLTGLDAQLLRFGTKQEHGPAAVAQPSPAGRAPATSGRARSMTVALMLLATAAGAAMLVPTRPYSAQRPVPDLNGQIPQRIGGWIQDEQGGTALVAPDLQSGVERIYSQTVARTYVDSQGRRIMLSIAYGGNQLGNALQAHRPEYCYKAQGFSLLASMDAMLPLRGGVLPVRRLVARQASRNEAITYWMTVGETAALPGIRRKLAQLRYGLSGEIPDGMLIRVSSLDGDAQRAFALQAAFIAEFQDALPRSLGFMVATTASERLPL